MARTHQLAEAEAKIERLEEQLRPFRRYAAMLEQHFTLTDEYVYQRLMVPGEEPAEITVADFRALAQPGDGGEVSS